MKMSYTVTVLAVTCNTHSECINWKLFMSKDTGVASSRARGELVAGYDLCRDVTRILEVSDP
jgi:hypothetical protein